MPRNATHFRLAANCICLAALLLFPQLSWGQKRTAEDYRKLLEKSPASASYAIGLARTLYNSGQQDQGLQTLKQFLDSYPNENQARTEYGNLLATSRRFEDALAQYQLVLDREPKDLRAQLGVAKILSWQGQFDAALDRYDQILSSHPHYHDAMVGKAFTLLWMGRKDDAKAAFLDAAGTNPRDKEVAEQLREMGITPPEPPPRKRIASSETKHSAETSALSKPKAHFPPVVDTPPAEDEMAPSDASPVGGNLRKWLWSLAALLAVVALMTLWSIWRSKQFVQAEEPLAATAPTSPRFTTVSTKPRGRSREPRERIPDLAKLQAQPKELKPSLLHQLQDSVTAVLGYSQILDTKVEGEALDLVKKIYGQALRIQKIIEELPKQNAKSDTAAEEAAPAAAPVSTSARFKLRGRILLINESTATLSLQRSVLAGAGAEIVSATEVPVAVSLLSKEKFDAVIVDADLSGSWSWLDVHKWLEKNSPVLASRMLLVCPANPDPELAQRIQRAQIGSISKPLDVKQLLSVTHSLLANVQTA
jgi:tetratricopeptide (TPR) repeat protein